MSYSKTPAKLAKVSETDTSYLPHFAAVFSKSGPWNVFRSFHWKYLSFTDDLTAGFEPI